MWKTSRPFVAALLSGAAGEPAFGQADLQWLEQFGTASSESGLALAPDSAGGTFVAGYTEGSLGGPWDGWQDAFVARYDSAGAQLWINQIGTGVGDYAEALAPDGLGGVFLAGLTGGDLGGPNAGFGDDVFLARYDGAGKQSWITQFGSYTYDRAWALAPDGAGGIFVAGSTSGDLEGPNAGQSDAFIARHDVTGHQIWIRQFGSKGGEEPRGLSSDNAGGVFVAGYTTGDLAGPNAGANDAFLSRFDADGNQMWIRQFGTGQLDEAEALQTDDTGGVLVAGNTTGSLGGANAGSYDYFLARYDGTGALTWVRQFGTSESDRAWAIATDDAGGSLVAGYTLGSLGGPNIGERDGFLAHHAALGDLLWTVQFGSDDDDYVSALITDGIERITVSGSTFGTLGGPNAGLQDVLLARFESTCYADLDANTTLDLFDFLAFTNLFNAQDPAADCDGDGAFTLFDFLCFTNAFNAGC